jgi:two-component system, LytTR family, sensor kinase
MDTGREGEPGSLERGGSGLVPEGRGNRLKAVLGAVVIFTAVGFLFAVELYIGLLGSEPARSFRYFLIWTLSTAWSWLTVFPLIIWCTRRWPFERARWGRAVAGHAVGFLLVAPLQALTDIILTYTAYTLFNQGNLSRMLTHTGQDLLSGLAGALVPYTVIAGLVHGARYYRRYRERELVATSLENALNLAHLQTLRAQLNPHFLFNTLNAIGALSRKDAEATNRMITLLCALLRRSLDSDGRQVVPLREEVDFVRDYLDIEKVRFPDRLQVIFDVPSDLLEAPVPSLVLQPLAENAIRHGIAPRSAPGHVTVKAREAGEILVMTVEDDGVGWGHLGPVEEGHGLRLTRERLRALYGQEASLEIALRPEGGTRATLKVPLLQGTAGSEREA